MSAYERPCSASDFAPYCDMPTPWPHPRPVSTIAEPDRAEVKSIDGTVCGNLAPLGVAVGYFVGKTHAAWSLRSNRNDPFVTVTDRPAPPTTTESPDRRTDVTEPPGQSPDA